MVNYLYSIEKEKSKPFYLKYKLSICKLKQEIYYTMSFKQCMKSCKKDNTCH